MKPEYVFVLSVLAFFVTLEICFTNFFHKQGQKHADAVVEAISATSLMLLIQPLVLASGAAIAAALFPRAQDILTQWPIWAIFGLFLVFDDMTQYWWHRLSHTTPWLYKLHRPHHNAQYLSIRVVYRNNLFYYLMMPGLWLSGGLIYLGAGWAYGLYLIIKMTVIFGAHCDVRWDEPLYKIKSLSPIMWVIERTISTPATHSAHHGKYAADNATHYKGNYGNLLFLWDVIFGTAKITRQYPTHIGVESLPQTTIMEQLTWPLARAPNSSNPVEKA